MVDAVLLELEGVVFDTRELRRKALRDALLEQGLAPTHDPDRLDGFAPRAAAQAALGHQGIPHDEVLTDLIALRAERAFAASLATGGTALCEGALDFVREAAAVARLAVVTRAKRADAESMLRLASLREFFAMVVSADDVLDTKPSSETHLLAIERLGRQRPLMVGQVIAIEDGEPGIRAARAAGLRCIAVGPLAAHVAMEADAYVALLIGQTIRTLDQLSTPGQERVQ